MDAVYADQLNILDNDTRFYKSALLAIHWVENIICHSTASIASILTDAIVEPVNKLSLERVKPIITDYIKAPYGSKLLESVEQQVIKRKFAHLICNNRVLLINVPRRVGKSALIKEIAEYKDTIIYPSVNMMRSAAHHQGTSADYVTVSEFTKVAQDGRFRRPEYRGVIWLDELSDFNIKTVIEITANTHIKIISLRTEL